VIAENWASGRVIVLGAKGMLGHELMLALGQKLGFYSPGRLFAYDLPELDICDGEAVRKTMRHHEADVVINAAAYTDVDGCESNPELAEAVNGEAAGGVAAACREAGAKMVHFSTDFVFDGRLRRPYRPDDPANPLSVYGRSKWMGEEAVRSAGGRSLVVRTSWLYGLNGRNFVDAILAQASSGRPLRVVSDQIGRPTLASDLADAVVRLLDLGAEGTVHFANSGECSWFEFAEEIIRQAAPGVTVQQITSEELRRPAERPAYSVLDLKSYIDLAGDVPATWRDALPRYLHSKRATALSAAESSTATGASEGPFRA